MNAPRSVAVTGASGFIGLPLCARLLEEGAQVRALVRRETPVLGELAAQGGLRQLAVGDLREFEDWSAPLRGVEAVVHLAARVHRAGASDGADQAEFDATNADVTLRLARGAARSGVRRLVFVSSAKAGTGAEDAYSRSKADAERRLGEESSSLGIECVIVRPPLVYGPRVRANFLRLLKLVDSGLPLPLASIANRRSLAYVGNLADALLACVEHPAASARTFAVSDGEDVSTPELVRRIARALGREARLFRVPVVLLEAAARLTGQSPLVDRLTRDLVVDPAPIRSALGWRPRFTLDEGLAETAAWYRARRRVAEAHTD